jgi:hypothetical protein
VAVSGDEAEEFFAPESACLRRRTILEHSLAAVVGMDFGIAPGGHFW